MERIQIYCNVMLLKALEQDARTRGLSLSQTAVEALREHYKLTPKYDSMLTLDETYEQVSREIREYVETLASGDEFSIIEASWSFSNIDMVADGKPSTNRARLGRIFAQNLDKFPQIERAYNSDGTVKKGSNKQTIYIKK